MNKEKTQQSGGTNFSELEKDILKFWDENQTFQKSLEQTKDGTPFVFYDGPPFATGLPHYGSILPSVIKDAIPRYQTMKGNYVRRRWGWDCHGLPIENIVEKSMGISGKKQIEEIGVDKFNQACRENVLRYADEWGKTIKRIARWVNFDPPMHQTSALAEENSRGSSDVVTHVTEADGNAAADFATINNSKRLGSYKTMDTSYQESVWWALKQLWKKDLIYEDRKVLLYCSRCETPISNFEVAMDNSYKDVTEESVFVKFKLLPRQRIINELTNDKTYLLAWTTTPWTLPGNTALNIGAEISYVTIEVESGEQYILAKERLSIISEKYEIINEILPRHLEGLEYEPLYAGVIPNGRNAEAGAAGNSSITNETGNSTEKRGSYAGNANRAHRIYIADFVTTTDGTGIVHNAAMYGEEDYQLAKQKDLPRMDMLDHKGHYLPVAPEHLRGVFFKNADKVVIKDLTEKNLLYKSEAYTHSYPHCYRCATPLFYNALPAWFINIQSIKQDLIANNENINWYPSHLKHGRFALGVQNAPDWNISRNRYWATALPFWKCEQGHKYCVESFRDLAINSVNLEDVYPNYKLQITQLRHSGDYVGQANSQSNPNYQIPKEELEQIDLHKPYIDRVVLKCQECGGEMHRVPEVVDCWVESGSMPFAELHYPFENNAESRANKESLKSTEEFQGRFPADFVVEYIPQTRAWFYVMHVISTAIFGQAPFKNVLTTGTILAEDGTKMSKSKNNYPDPGLIIEKYGADALRFYLLTSPVVNGEDINFSEKGVQEVNRKLSLVFYNVWTFYRLYESKNLSLSADQLISLQAGHIMDKWVLAKLSETQMNVTRYMDAFDTVRAGKSILEFVNETSTWFVRRSRERIKQGNEDSKAALNVLGYVISETCKMLAPFMPFLSEYIYKNVTGKESVHLDTWSEPSNVDQSILENMSVVRELVETGMALRKELALKVRQPLSEIEYHLKNGKILPTELENVLSEEMNVKTVSGRTDFSPKNGWAYKETPGFKFTLNLEITPELKKEGLARELERQVQDLRKKSGLKVGDLVDLYYNTQSLEAEEALLSLLDRKKTFVSQVSKSFEVEVDYESQGEVDGQAVWLGMTRI
ncbi:MAG: isoleucine--tRNA ligase [Candidatus Doudnabacteria bacterium]|nr:isoleucine--tRNA ligase [Candidatus Doudnabacteria bacterium]